MTHFLYLVRHGEAAPHDGPLSPAPHPRAPVDRYPRSRPASFGMTSHPAAGREGGLA